MKLPWKLPLLLDGAAGTVLMGLGMPADVCVEQWILEHPDIWIALQRRYIAAGCDVLYAPTFGANRVHLKQFGLENQVHDMNCQLVALSKQAMSGSSAHCMIAGDLSPTGWMPDPYGEVAFTSFLDVYKEQVAALIEAGVDLIVCETMTNLTEARAALLAARESKLPVFVTLTVDEVGHTLSGSPLLPCVITLQALGASAIGFNCSTGLADMAEWISSVFPHAAVPLIAKPNAMITSNAQSNPLSPLQFANGMEELLDAGATIVGGCCGTTPEHLAVLRGVVDRHPTVVPYEIDIDAAAGEREAFFLVDDLVPSPPILCDSRLMDSLIEAEDSYNVARVHIASSADIGELLAVASVSHLPTAIYTDSATLLDETLMRYPGRLLVDSLCEIETSLLEDIAAQYGSIVF